MPYKSKAQQRKFNADPKLREHAEHWNEETKKSKKGFKGLPERVRKKKGTRPKGKSPSKATKAAKKSKRK